MGASPVAHHLNYWAECPSIRGKRIINAGRNRSLVVSFNDAIGDEFLKMPDQHARGDELRALQAGGHWFDPGHVHQSLDGKSHSFSFKPRTMEAHLPNDFGPLSRGRSSDCFRR